MSFVWPSLSVRVLTFFANTQLSGTALTKAQREKVGSFCSFVGVAGVNDKIAVKFLKVCFFFFFFFWGVVAWT